MKAIACELTKERNVRCYESEVNKNVIYFTLALLSLNYLSVEIEKKMRKELLRVNDTIVQLPLQTITLGRRKYTKCRL